MPVHMVSNGVMCSATAILNLLPLQCCRAGTPHSSVGFFTVIALPLISAWVEVFPECEPILKQVMMVGCIASCVAVIVSAMHS